VKRTASATGPVGSATVTLTIPNFAQDKKKLTVVAGVLAGVVAVLGYLVVTKKGEAPPAVAALTAPDTPQSTTPPAPVPATEAPKAAPASGADEKHAEPAKPAEPPKPAGPAVHQKAEPVKPAEPAKVEAGKPAEPAKPAAPAVPPATVVFAIQPWGEVFVNGKSGGVSPPMKSMKLAPGKYKIEIRNTTFAAHTESIEVKSRDELTIRHRFQ